MSILTFPALLGASQSFTVASQAGTLGDGLDQLSLPIARIVEDNWQLTSIPLHTADKDNLVATLKANLIKGSLWQLRPNLSNTYADFNVYVWELEQDKQGLYEWDSWTTNPIGGDYWQVDLTLNRTGHQEIDECLLRPTDLAETYPLFPLNLYLNGAKNRYEATAAKQRMRGGVEERRRLGYQAVKDLWSFTATIHEYKKNEVVQFLSDRCGNFFEFQILPGRAGKIYTCDKWIIKQVGRDYWDLSVEFKRSYLPFRPSDIKRITDLFDFYDSQDKIIEVMDATFADIDEKLDGAYDWLLRYKRDEYPYILNDRWVIRNAFHKVLGRGGYFPSGGAPTEAEAVLARAGMQAYFATGKQKWLELAINAGNCLLDVFYPLKIPSGWTPADGIRVPHWLTTTESFTSKGALSTTGDPLNMGHFDLVINFVNGVGQIPYGDPNYGELVANLYRVYPLNDRLLWQNVYAAPLGGYSYPIDYWVTNVLLEGVVSRQYADSESPSGRRPTPTNEPLGKIVLATPFTGQAKIVYSSYTGPIIQPNELFEPYPMYRKLRPNEALGAIDVFPWADDAYRFLYAVTLDLKWLDALNCNRYTEVIAATVINPSAWYKARKLDGTPEDSPNPLAYAGSQVILANYPPGSKPTVSRVTSGDKNGWIKIDTPAPVELYPSVELQNFAVQAKVISETQIYVESACSVAAELEVVISLSKNAFDFSQYYIARMPVIEGGTRFTRLFSPREFLLWDTSQTAWYPHNADNPIYTYNGQGGDASATRDTQIIDNIPRSVWKLELDRNRGFAGAGFVLIHAKPRLPLQIYLKHQGDDARILVRVDGRKYNCKLEAGEWQRLRLDSNAFSSGDDKPGGGYATTVEIEADGDSTTWVWWVGAPPKELPAPCQTYKAALVSRVRAAHTFWCGEFTTINSPSDKLKYSNGMVPFTVNVENNGKDGQFVSAWRGKPQSGYAYPAWYAVIGYWDRLDLVLDYLRDAQLAYKDQNVNKTNGPFAPAYDWEYWDSIDLTTGVYNTFNWLSVDPNSGWEGYQCRPAESVAHAWCRMVTGEYPGEAPANLSQLIEKAKNIAMNFANWLSAFYVKRLSFQPPTDFPPNTDPEVRYTTTHFAAFMLRFAVYCNIAGGNSAVTMRLIKASYDFLDTQYIRSGTMQGSFFASQPTFVGADGQVYREAFGFHIAEAIESLAVLKLKKHLLNYPKCVFFVKKPV